MQHPDLHAPNSESGRSPAGASPPCSEGRPSQQPQQACSTASPVVLGPASQHETTAVALHSPTQVCRRIWLPSAVSNNAIAAIQRIVFGCRDVAVDSIGVAGRARRAWDVFYRLSRRQGWSPRRNRCKSRVSDRLQSVLSSRCASLWPMRSMSESHEGRIVEAVTCSLRDRRVRLETDLP